MKVEEGNHVKWGERSSMLRTENLLDLALRSLVTSVKVRSLE